MMELPYRPCVGIALFNRRGEVFAGRRKDGEGGAPELRLAWQMPQGGIDPGEDPYQAAIRELYEETSISSIALLGEAPGWLTYDLPPELLGKVWKGRYRGQSQKWFAFRFTGEESEINIDAPPGGHKPEFAEWRWMPLQEMPGAIVSFKRAIYSELARVFAEFSVSDATVIRGS
jgi:putative (di)nucleoside polyphosphate hydrolase